MEVSPLNLTGLEGEVAQNRFITGVVENPTNPMGFLAVAVIPATPNPQNSVQWIQITTAPPVLGDFSLRPHKSKIFVLKRLKLDPNPGLIHLGHVAARSSSGKSSYTILPQRARI